MMVITAPLLVADWKASLSFCSLYLQEVESVFSTSQVFDPHNVPEIPLSVTSRLCGLDFRSLRRTPHNLTKSDCLAPVRMRQEVTIETEEAWETASVSAISQEEFGQRESSWISCFSIAVIKHHAQGKQKKRIYLGIWLHGDKSLSWQEVGGMVSGAEIWEFTFWTTSMKQGERTRNSASLQTLKASSNTFSSSKPYLLSLSTQQYQLGTKCSNAQDYAGGGWRLLFKSP